MMGQTALKVVKLHSARKHVYYRKIFLGSECDGNNMKLVKVLTFRRVMVNKTDVNYR